MESVTAKSRESFGKPPHMGSEYLDAQTYLAQQPRVRPLGASGKKATNEPQHGSNDSDFGAADQDRD